MLTSSQFRQNLTMMLTGGALVVGGMALSHRPEAVAVPSLPQADDLSAVFRQVASEAIPSIVSIEAMTKSKQVEPPLRDFFRNDPKMEEMLKNRGSKRMLTKGKGSGFIINSNGSIMTSSHVVKGADEVKVRLHDGREFIAKDIKTDPRTDVAIVRIDAPDLKSIHLGDSRSVHVGDWVLAIGSPFGLDMTVTAGIISAKGRSNRITERADFLQTDAAINPGNSGGPLINMRGEAIGINTAIATESGGYDGIGFAVPTHIAAWVGEQLMSAGEVKRGYLGTQISAIDVATAKQLNIQRSDGVIAHKVLPGSPAQKAGVERGDIIVRLDGQKIDGPSVLQGVAEQLTVGKTYPLDVVRGGKRMTLNVTIDALPKDKQTSPLSESGDDDGALKTE
jgi:serine protease Do